MGDICKWIRRFFSSLPVITVFLPLLSVAAPEQISQETFSSPTEARDALAHAAGTGNASALAAIFGPTYAELDPGDPVQKKEELRRLSEHLRENAQIILDENTKATLVVGARNWPFPVPIVKDDKGWFFDTDAGREEILNRRIGRNEILAINACLAYVEAQRDYYDMPEPDGVQIPKYAQRFISTTGRHDGLYWSALPGAEESPLAPLVSKARQQGYFQERKNGNGRPWPFHGYYFRILKQQGPSAPGGKFSYVINGNMIAGHALVAYPAKWGKSGIMTFIVNQRGRVYQKNLGPATAEIARHMKAYDPDLSWKLVEEQ